MIYEIEKLHFKYRGGEREVLNGVSLTIAEGELVSVLGRNGAGKSTLFGCMLGLLKPQSGSIKICGSSLHTMNERQVAGTVAYVPQNHNPTFDFTVLEYVLMGCASKVGLLSKPGTREEAAAETALRRMGILQLAERRYTELSGGERQQATIARAIAAEPRVILFDEPTAHLDFANQIKVLRIIKGLSENGYSVAVTTHDPNHALLLGGTAAILDGEGKLCSGKVSELITEERLKGVYGADVRLRYLDEFSRDVCIYPNL